MICFLCVCHSKEPKGIRIKNKDEGGYMGWQGKWNDCIHSVLSLRIYFLFRLILAGRGVVIVMQVVKRRGYNWSAATLLSSYLVLARWNKLLRQCFLLLLSFQLFWVLHWDLNQPLDDGFFGTAFQKYNKKWRKDSIFGAFLQLTCAPSCAWYFLLYFSFFLSFLRLGMRRKRER